MAKLQEEICEAHAEHVSDAISESIFARYDDPNNPPREPQWLAWDRDDALLRPGPGRTNTSSCPNVRMRPGLWGRDDPKALDGLVNPDAPFLNRLAQLCETAGIQQCNRQACSRQRTNMEGAAPQCDWPCFRQWAISAMACQAGFTHEQKLTRAHTHVVTAVSLCHWLLIGYKHRSEPIDDVMVGARRHRVDLAGVCEVIYWMLTIQAHIGLRNVAEGKWGTAFLPDEVVQPALTIARDRATRLGICQYRLQKLTEVAERQEADLPGIMEMAQHYPLLSHCKDAEDKDHYHAACTPGECGPNTADTTEKAQLHKCSRWNQSSCPTVRYSVDALEDSITSVNVSRWSRHGRRPAAPGEQYVALSHAWIDGTGIGNGPDPTNRKNMGRVNRCLDEYFLRIVKRLDCTAFWWDTISLPTTPDIRKREIDKMHYIYREATHTVVHDNSLVDFKWADDGSPCVALVLSSWFTRGWTALELHESRKSVKVLYKGPDPDNPLIKDLDRDILAVDPRYATRAHWIASSIIRRLRRPIENVRDLLSILRPRSTCRTADRTSISGLLADLEPSTCPQCNESPFLATKGMKQEEAAPIRKRIKNHIKTHTTRRVLTKLGKVGYTSLIHGLEPMHDSGAFSWTPQALHKMSVHSGGDLRPGIFGDGLLSVDVEGRAVGSWFYRSLTPDDADWIVEPMEHSSLKTDRRIRKALRNWQNCLILRESWQDRGPALLAAKISTYSVDGGSITDCRYVGAVNVSYDANPCGEGYDRRYKYGTIRFGNDVPEDDDGSSIESEEIPEDGEEEGWISTDSEGPRRPRNMFRS